MNVYVGSDGKLHFVNSGGADSVLPFNNKPAYYTVSTGRELVSRDLGRVNVYVGSDGKLHFVNSGGADSVLPFNNKPAYYTVSTGRELAVGIWGV